MGEVGGVRGGGVICNNIPVWKNQCKKLQDKLDFIYFFPNEVFAPFGQFQEWTDQCVHVWATVQR